MAASWPGEKSVIIIDGADHFFAGHVERMSAALAGWLTSRHPELSH